MQNMSISRRNLLKWGTIAAASATQLTACSQNDAVTEQSSSIVQSEAQLAAGGQWKPSFCFLGCGGGCVNMSYVKDGVILRQKTDDSHPDSIYYPQLRGCIKGRATRYLVYGADRLKYPMKRKGWQPGGGTNSNGEERGTDAHEWERISWDEAIAYIGDELTRIYKDHGALSVLNLASEINVQTLNYMGGSMSQWGQMSLGAWPLVTNMMTGGLWRSAYHSGADRMTMLGNTELLVLWGQNPAWSKVGISSHTYRALKEKGKKIIFVDPWYNPSMQALCDEWVPVRPATDLALLLGIAHELIIQNLVDKDFLDKYTVGFDADTMPNELTFDADTNVHTDTGNKVTASSFYDYVMDVTGGTYIANDTNRQQGANAKTAEWASKICGTPVAVIKELARQMGTVKPMSLKISTSTARTESGPQMVQAFYTVGWMTGNIGVDGAEVTAEGQNIAYVFSGTPLVSGGGSRRHMSGIVNPVCTGPRGTYIDESTNNGISSGSHALSIQRGTFEKTYKGGDSDGQDVEYGVPYGNLWQNVLDKEYTPIHSGGTKKAMDIKAFIGLGMNGGNRISSVSDANVAIKAFRSAEFVVTADFYYTMDGRHSDIVLPICTPWESGSCLVGHREFKGYAADRVVDPLYESKSDDEVEILLFNYLNVGQDHSLITQSEAQYLHNSVVGCKVIKEDGSGYDNICSVTADDVATLAAQGVTATEQEGRMSYNDFRYNKGYYQVERSEGDAFGYTPYKDYITDPVANAMATPSGKLEIYCQRVVDRYGKIGLSTIAPIAQYVNTEQGYNATFTGNKVGTDEAVDTTTKSEFPMQYVTIHPLHRVHSTYCSVTQLQEVAGDSVYINDRDAFEQGISHGDWVLVSSVTESSNSSDTTTVIPRKIARRATVTPTVISGVVIAMEGGRMKMANKDTGNDIDISGNTQTLTKGRLVGEGFLAWNSSICKVEKLDKSQVDINGELLPDYLMPLHEPKFAN